MLLEPHGYTGPCLPGESGSEVLETFLPLCSPTLLPGGGIVSCIQGWRGKKKKNAAKEK